MAGNVASSEAPRLPLAANNHSRLSTSAEITVFLDALVATSRVARKEIIGTTELGRPIEALVLAEPDRSGARFRVMVVGSQHGAAEGAGTEALLAVAHELVQGALRPLLHDIDIVLVPNANPDGRDLRRRSNANRVNINTDFVRLSQSETRALNAAVSRFAPDAILDAHESAVLKRKTLAREGLLTDFEAQFETGNNPGIPAALRNYTLQELLPALTQRVSAAGLPAQRYVGEIISSKQAITHGGLTLRNFRNKAAMSGAVSFLVETKLDSRDEEYPTWRNIAVRVDKQVLCITAFIKLMHENRDRIGGVVQAARANAPIEPVTLRAEYVADEEHPRVAVTLRQLATGEPVVVEFPDHRRVVTHDTLEMPASYILTRETAAIREALDRHGIKYSLTSSSIGVRVWAQRLRRRTDGNQGFSLVEERQITLQPPPGSLRIDLAQPTGRSVPLLLDPRSISSLFCYEEYAKLIDPAAEFFLYRTTRGKPRSLP